MALTISQKVSALLRKDVIKGDDAYALVSRIEKDNKISMIEAHAMAKIARLKDDRFEKASYGVHSGVEELRSVSNLAKEMLDAKLVVTSSVPNVKIAWAKQVSIENSDYGNLYRRELSVAMKGTTVAKDGVVEFTYGGFHIKVPVKKGMTSARLFGAIESRILRQQNGAMSVSGGMYSPKVMNPAVSFGIHMVAPMTPREKVQYQIRMLEADVWELQSEGAPQCLIDPALAAIKKLEAKLAKMPA